VARVQSDPPTNPGEEVRGGNSGCRCNSYQERKATRFHGKGMFDCFAHAPEMRGNYFGPYGVAADPPPTPITARFWVTRGYPLRQRPSPSVLFRQLQRKINHARFRKHGVCLRTLFVKTELRGGHNRSNSRSAAEEAAGAGWTQDGDDHQSSPQRAGLLGASVRPWIGKHSARNDYFYARLRLRRLGFPFRATTFSPNSNCPHADRETQYSR